MKFPERLSPDLGIKCAFPKFCAIVSSIWTIMTCFSQPRVTNLHVLLFYHAQENLLQPCSLPGCHMMPPYGWINTLCVEVHGNGQSGFTLSFWSNSCILVSLELALDMHTCCGCNGPSCRAGMVPCSQHHTHTHTHIAHQVTTATLYHCCRCQYPLWQSLS